ncbi:MAG: hypothetical protein Q4C73_06345 [Eubacteriales bacterium]|nr:hypothetical protein [Eubacteriales bacterium]
MAFLYLGVGIAALLAVFFSYDEYKKNSISKTSFTWVAALECAACIGAVILAVMEIM